MPRRSTTGPTAVQAIDRWHLWHGPATTWGRPWSPARHVRL